MSASLHCAQVPGGATLGGGERSLWRHVLITSAKPICKQWFYKIGYLMLSAPHFAAIASWQLVWFRWSGPVGSSYSHLLHVAN